MIQRPITKTLVGTRLSQAATTMQTLSVTLLSLSIPCQAAHLTPQERILALPHHSFIEVKLADRTRVRGRLDKIDTDGFIVTTPAADQARVIERRISFTEVKSVKQLKDYRSDGRLSTKALIVIAILAVAIGPIVLGIGGDH